MILLVNAEARRLPLPAGIFHLIVTSPPYWGLRSYQGTGSWEGGDPECEHEAAREKNRFDYSFQPDAAAHLVARGGAPTIYKDVCPLCGARRVDAQLGLEKLHDCLGWATGDDCGSCFICHLREWMREVWRVLRDDGQAWVNLGDAYAHGKPGGGSVFDGGRNDGRKSYDTDGARGREKTSTLSPGLKPKDLCLIPQRAALALQADGWYVRSMIPWIKRNPMPESVTDRPTTAHEYWLQLTKRARYAADGEAWREKHTSVSVDRAEYEKRRNGSKGWKSKELRPTMPANKVKLNPSGRSHRTSDFFFESLDQEIADARARLRHLKEIRKGEGLLLDEHGEPLAAVFNTRGYGGSHYATFPVHMIEAIIKFASPEKCCPKCGKGWERVIEKESYITRPTTGRDTQKQKQSPEYSAGLARTGGHVAVKSNALGFRPACDCDAGDPVPALVGDIFVGSGSTLLAARALGRNGIGCDLSLDYLREQARPRLGLEALDAWQTGKSGETDLEGLPLFENGG